MFCNKNLTYTFVRENTPVSWANLDYIKKMAQHGNHNMINEDNIEENLSKRCQPWV